MENDPNSTALTVSSPSDPVSRLTPREKVIYEAYCKAVMTRQIAPQIEAGMYLLYLQGKAPEEIAKLHPSVSLGAVLWLRVVRRWDEKVDKYREELSDSAEQRAKQTFLEAAEFLSDTIAVAHRQEREGLQKFLLDGNKEHLGPLAIKDHKQYLKTLESLGNLTGANRTTRVKGEVQHVHVMTSPAGADPKVVEGSVVAGPTPLLAKSETVRRALPPAQAKAILGALTPEPEDKISSDDDEPAKE